MACGSGRRAPGCGWVWGGECAPCSAAGVIPAGVHQPYPAVLRVSPGETMTLSCSFEKRQGSRVKATWTRAPGVVLDSAHPFYSGRLNVSHLDLLQKGEATLTLSELEQRDSGLYQCQIEFYQGESGTGAGTELQVMGKNQSDTGEVGNGGTGPSPSLAAGQGTVWLKGLRIP
uniref:Ig-like domain-containing protein n=1 Tax=Chrysemys picta bellii TaxID=8478 RepID=A0A8C3HM73_CHRPI